MDRIANIREWIEENPEDPFNHYALALEYRSVNPKHCMALLEDVVKAFPDYLPTYLPLGELQLEAGLDDAGFATLAAGITLAAKLGNTKAKGELMGLRDGW